MKTEIVDNNLEVILVNTMKDLINGKIDLDRVEGLCALADRVILNKKVEYDFKKHEARIVNGRSNRLLIGDIDE